MADLNIAALMSDMGIDSVQIESRRRAARIEESDVASLRGIAMYIDDYASEAAEEFIRYLRESSETRPLLDGEIESQIRLLKVAHIREMGRGEYDERYVRQRLELALLYGRIDLPVRWFLGAFNHLMRFIGLHVMAALGDEQRALQVLMSLEKLATFDAALMVDTLVFRREQTIRDQEEAIRELSTPVLQIRNRLLILPIIGAVDRARARLLTDGLLRSIRENRAKVVIMDVTGVPSVDSEVANHLIHAIEASRLMGATVILTGLAPEIAHTIVTLGVDLSKVHTVGDLQGGLEEGERILGLVVRSLHDRSRRHARDGAHGVGHGSRRGR